jgi:hypothetical protein
LTDGSSVQRWLCRKCAFRFSDRPLQENQEWQINTQATLPSKRQICALGAKNLRVPTRKHVGAGVLTDEVKASIDVFEGWMQKEGYAKSNYRSNLRTLVYLGADLSNPESVKETIGSYPVKNGTKLQYVYAYSAFCKMLKIDWEPPSYRQEEIIPFIPDEGELDQLIAAARLRRMATYLHTL